ncbi:flagellar export chaperone FliS [Oleiagrimonas sp. C23AA]|uniref:flagellar export chaperone FliS n=1 Tax=Oleiagrimonas sp. C23AA TaxID=2719047 RepID=UPI00141E4401|nr:flagellar export chaperone FliS [Oleiagrimonas sp. C23AA]NII09201.1 flagellar export chaperone FliS [Oleiagrimonas sp. C23AA]
MTYAMMNAASSLYRETSAHGSIEGADRHQLISMLFDALLERMNAARGQIMHGNVTGKGESFARALAMVTELRASLDHSVDSQFSARLDSLYDYVSRRLLTAQLNDDLVALNECISLITPVRDAWHEIREQYLANPPADA